MSAHEKNIDSFENNIKEAINALKSNEYCLAQKYVTEAMLINEHAPEVYNLLGAISELTGDLTLACSYYRVSCIFDPVYKPANKNLERATSFFYIFNKNNIIYEEEPEKEKELFYFIEFDEKNVGHLKTICR